MNFRSRSLTLSTILGAALLFGGCATTGIDRSVKTSNSMQEVDNEIRKTIVQIDVTSSSLDTVMFTRTSELGRSFKTYSDNVVKLDKEGKRTLKRLEEMKSRSKEYFTEWEKQGDTFTNEEIRALSEERRSRLAGSYARVTEAGIGIKGAYHAYLTDLKEIQMFLSNDLTPEGVETIAPSAQRTSKDRDALKDSLVPLLAALDAIKAELYSGKK